MLILIDVQCLPYRDDPESVMNLSLQILLHRFYKNSSSNFSQERLPFNSPLQSRHPFVRQLVSTTFINIEIECKYLMSSSNINSPSLINSDIANLIIGLSIFKNEKQPNKRCNDYESCIAINRLLSSLKYYSSLNISNNKNDQMMFVIKCMNV